MTLYPVEAGKPVGDRIHPFIPIPLADVDEAITGKS
jgi:hypothetical protein